MVQGEEGSSWMANDRAVPVPLNQALAYGIQGSTPAAAAAAAAAAVNFLSHQPAAAAAAYFGELEEALIHGVDGMKSDGHTKSAAAAAEAAYLTARPPTLEIFPAWPMRRQQLQSGNSQSVGSTTDSSSAQNTMSQMELVSPVSMRASSEQAAAGAQTQQEVVMMMATDDYNCKAGASAAASLQQHGCHDKKKSAGSTRKDGKLLDAKTARRLAQNREAARKSRLRKKAYVQQLETSRIRLQQLEQELQRARSQGLFLGGCGATGDMSSGAAMFDMEYARWLDDDGKHLSELRGALQAHLPDGNLGQIVDECISHYGELFDLRAVLAKSDVFHLLNGMWATAAERCFLWMGGFRPSDLIKILTQQLDPLTEQQLMEIYTLQKSSLQAEEALWQGLEQLHQSLAETIAMGPINDGMDMTSYMGLMVVALDKLRSLESFIQQADNLRQQTLHQLRKILTTRQAARCFLAIGEYYRRLRALSSLWASRPRENFIANESVSPTGADLQAINQLQHSQFPSY